MDHWKYSNFGWLSGCVLLYIDPCRLFDAKYYIHIYTYIYIYIVVGTKRGRNIFKWLGLWRGLYFFYDLFISFLHTFLPF